MTEQTKTIKARFLSGVDVFPGGVRVRSVSHGAKVIRVTFADGTVQSYLPNALVTVVVR